MMNSEAGEQSTAVQMILAQSLQKSLDAWMPESQILTLCRPADIPLNRVKSALQLKYTSAIALKLAPASTALRLAQQITENLRQTLQSDSTPLSLHPVCQNLKISTAAPGWIDLELSAAGLAVWLWQMTSSVLTLDLDLASDTILYESKADNHAAQLMISYSHARCCSLLTAADAAWSNWRLALAQPELFVARWQPAEWQLIGLLVDLVDDLACGSAPASLNLLSKRAHSLSLGVEAFYAACSIWGVAAQSRELANRRLGLLLLAQQLLRILLKRLNLPAPEQL